MKQYELIFYHLYYLLWHLDNNPAIYEELKDLAIYFEKYGDNWLADHFYYRCLQIAYVIDNDEGKTQSEANCNFGISLINRGNLTIFDITSINVL